MERDNTHQDSNDIDSSISKKNDLLKLLDDYEVKVYSNADVDYDYLSDESFMLVVINPYGDNTLEIEIGDECTVFFAGWHAHYFTFASDYEEMKKDITGILEGDIGVLLVANSTGRFMHSELYFSEISHLTDEIGLLSNVNEETTKHLFETGGKIYVKYWKPADSFTFDIPIGGKI